MLNSVGLLYAMIIMEPNLIKNSQDCGLSFFKVVADTFKVATKKREHGQRGLLILIIFSFVIFEMPFPVDDNLLFLYFKVKMWYILSLSCVTTFCLCISRKNSTGLKRTLQILFLFGHFAWLLVNLL